jgi:hypothetical protein
MNLILCIVLHAINKVVEEHRASSKVERTSKRNIAPVALTGK